MISLKELIEIDRNSKAPVYQQIMNSIIFNTRRGYLRRGLKLPGTRELAAMLKIHRKTLQNALDELVAQGWLEIIPRKGTFITTSLPEINPVKFSSFKEIKNYPAKTLYPINEKNFVKFPTSAEQAPTDLVMDDGLPDVRLAPLDNLIAEYRSLSKLSAFKNISATLDLLVPPICLMYLHLIYAKPEV